ncbi:MAG: methyltransferase domain-containing protein [Nitrococcus sp.]|nr:methyltransferase domain-containing protein [Nitrococcus sp.]
MDTTKQQLLCQGQKISTTAGVMDGQHAYFTSQFPRVYESIRRFDLLAQRLGDVLEIGPYYAYLPFFLRKHAATYTVMEGDDPAVYPLLPLYREHSIEYSCVDLFEMFGPVHSARHALPLPGEAYDTILCWDTIEHFSFNPVKFVRELHRLLRPGGRAYVTVPNRASFQNLVGVLFGRSEQEHIAAYYQFENYESNGKKAYYGFHWREYSPPELRRLFTGADFRVTACRSFTAFQDYGSVSIPRNIARAASRWGTSLLPRFGTHVLLMAEK